MEFISDELLAYAEDHTSSGSDLLKLIERETNLEVLMPRMLSGKLQGRLLAMLSKMIKPNFILEIGTYTGYSALCLAEGLAAEGKLITIEKNPELEARIRKYFKKSAFKNQLELVIGNAATIIPAIEGSPDLVFIDADKAQYLHYFELAMKILKPNGYIIADNVLWSGKVLDTEINNDADTIALKEFNNFVQSDTRVENILIPVRDGLMLLRKL